LNSDKVIIKEIDSIPKEDGGSPLPVFFSDDAGPLFIAYHMMGHDKIAVIKFSCIYEFRNGYPNDEGAHPLMRYGLGVYGLFLVENSPRIKKIIEEQSVDSRKSKGWWKSLNHWVFRFKETTLEVIGEDYEVIAIDEESRTTRQALIKIIN